MTNLFFNPILSWWSNFNNFKWTELLMVLGGFAGICILLDPTLMDDSTETHSRLWLDLIQSPYYKYGALATSVFSIFSDFSYSFYEPGVQA